LARRELAHIKSGRWLWGYSIAAACILYLSDSEQVNAAEECADLYKAISAQHTEATHKLKRDSDAFYRSMHELENALFSALQQCPQHPLLFTLMAENQIAFNNHQLANVYAQKAHQQQPDLWQTNHVLGTTLVMQQKYEKGLSLLKRAVQIAPQRSALHFNLCSSYVLSGRYQQAVETCSSLLKKKGHELHAEIYLQRSLAYKALDKISLADEDFSRSRAFSKNR